MAHIACYHDGPGEQTDAKLRSCLLLRPRGACLMSLVNACQSHAQFRRAELATIDGGVERNWGEFVERIARAASGLAGLGVNAGDRVGILALNSADYLVVQVAVWWIGAVVVPMNIRWTAEENIYSTADSGLSVLVADATFGPAALAVQAAQGHVRLVSLDADAPQPFVALEALISANAPAADAWSHLRTCPQRLIWRNARLPALVFPALLSAQAIRRALPYRERELFKSAYRSNSLSYRYILF